MAVPFKPRSTNSAQNNASVQDEFLTQNEFFTEGAAPVTLLALVQVIQSE
jgi:hypothetical protein